VEGQEPLAGQIEAVVGLELAANDLDMDLLQEEESLSTGQGVAFAVDRAQEVPRGPAARRQQEVVLVGVAGSRVGVTLALGIGKPTQT
jgi:hypothetical protein